MKNVIVMILSLIISLNNFAQTVIKMEQQNGVYVMPCKVNGLMLKFIIDTGASGVSISITEARFMLKNDYLKESDILGTGLYKNANGDISEGTEIILRQLEIGMLQLSNIEASIVNNLDAPLLLGQSALSKLGKIEIDYTHHTLTIIEGASDSIVDSKKTADYYFFRGIAKEDKNDLTGAVQDYSKALQLNPSYAQAYYNRGLLKYTLKDYTGAILDYNKVIELLPNFADVYNNRGNTKIELDDFIGAVSDFTTSIELDPNNLEAYINRGNVKTDLGDYPGAIKDCNKAIAIDPQHPGAYDVRGIAKIQLNDYSGAIQDFSKSIVLDPNKADTYLNRGIAKALNGDINGACYDWSRAGELGSKDAYELINHSCK